eukprot:426579_1
MEPQKQQDTICRQCSSLIANGKVFVENDLSYCDQCRGNDRDECCYDLNERERKIGRVLCGSIAFILIFVGLSVNKVSYGRLSYDLTLYCGWSGYSVVGDSDHDAIIENNTKASYKEACELEEMNDLTETSWCDTETVARVSFALIICSATCALVGVLCNMMRNETNSRCTKGPQIMYVSTVSCALISLIVGWIKIRNCSGHSDGSDMSIGASFIWIFFAIPFAAVAAGNRRCSNAAKVCVFS